MKTLKKIIVKDPKSVCPAEISIKLATTCENYKDPMHGISDGKMHMVYPESKDNIGTIYLIENEKNVFVEAGISIRNGSHFINFNLCADEFEVIVA